MHSASRCHPLPGMAAQCLLDRPPQQASAAGSSTVRTAQQGRNTLSTLTHRKSVKTLDRALPRAERRGANNMPAFLHLIFAARVDR